MQYLEKQGLRHEGTDKSKSKLTEKALSSAAVMFPLRL
jgi:hypothetical protein